MYKIPIEGRRDFSELAAEHADDFKARVARHDRENTFPFENLDAMKTSDFVLTILSKPLCGTIEVRFDDFGICHPEVQGVSSRSNLLPKRAWL